MDPPGRSWPRRLGCGLDGAPAAQGVAGERDAVGIVDEAVEDGIGVGGIAEGIVPLLDGELAGDEGGAASIALFGDLEEFVAGLGVDGLEGEVVKDEQLDAEQGATEAGVAAVAAGERVQGERLFRTRPLLIVEVLSPGTELTDTRDKLQAHQRIESLLEYVIVEQERPEVRVIGRTAQGWDSATCTGTMPVRLASVDLTLALADIYRDVEA